jgi:flagellar biosynthesis GTPase FlhF
MKIQLRKRLKTRRRITMAKGKKSSFNTQHHQQSKSQKKSKKQKEEEAEQEERSSTHRQTKKERKQQQRKQRKLTLSDQDVIKFNEQLQPLGLFIHEVCGDGNCLFRSIADQLDQDENKYETYRQSCVDFMRKNPDQFAPFLVDTDFEEYCDEMASDGKWGGNLELVAVSWSQNVNITVYQLEAPKFEIVNFTTPRAIVHLSYHLGEHYNSVRAVNKKVLDILNTHSSTMTEFSKKTQIVLQSIQSTIGSDSTYLSKCNEQFIVSLLHRYNGDADLVVEHILSDYETSDIDGIDLIVAQVREFVDDRVSDQQIIQTLLDNDLNIEIAVSQLLNSIDKQQERTTSNNNKSKKEATMTRKERKKIKQHEKSKERARQVMEEHNRKNGISTESSSSINSKDDFEIDDEELKKLVSNTSSVRI